MDLNPLGSSTGNAQRKVRFKPKAPPKREQRLALPKAEKDENDVDEVKAEQLLCRYKETSSTGRVKPERKVGRTEVAFGIGASSRTLRSYGSSKDFLNIGDMSFDGAASLSVGKEYKEPWDYYSNYPTTLPIRRPYSGNPGLKCKHYCCISVSVKSHLFDSIFVELLDQEEFGDDPVRSEYVENETNITEELGLLEKTSERKIFYFKIPSLFPAIEESTDSEVPGKNSQKLCKLELLPYGLIGKMLRYKNGAVKLKIGDSLYEVSQGLNCTFAQDIVAINRVKKHCANFGELNKRAVVNPDIDSMWATTAS